MTKGLRLVPSCLNFKQVTTNDMSSNTRRICDSRTNVVKYFFIVKHSLIYKWEDFHRCLEFFILRVNRLQTNIQRATAVKHAGQPVLSVPMLWMKRFQCRTCGNSPGYHKLNTSLRLDCSNKWGVGSSLQEGGCQQHTLAVDTQHVKCWNMLFPWNRPLEYIVHGILLCISKVK
jgi:hypothetical protein